MELIISRRSPDGSWSESLPEWDSASTLVQVFGPAALLDDPSPMQELIRLYPNSIIVGCSGAGVLIDDELSDNDLIVSIARFRKVRITSAMSTISQSGNEVVTGKEMLNNLLAQDPGISGILLMASGKITDGDLLSAGFVSNDSVNVIKVAGGLAGTVPGEDGEFGTTWALDENRCPVDGAIIAIGFSGDDLIFKNAAQGGWKPLGPERIVTNADEHTVHEIDGRPALELYKEYLGDHAKELPVVASRFPFASRPRNSDDDEWAPAGIIAIDEATNSLQLTRKIVEGSHVQMQRGYSGELFDAAEEAANDLNPISDGTQLAVVTSCLGRRIALGSRTADELSYVRQALSKEVGMVGFYGMGEFSSTSSSPCKFYNYTMTIALIGERE